MKKIFLVIAALIIAASCTKNESEQPIILTFEGSYWNALIDGVQYGGELLYGDMNAMTGTQYSWYDSENTGLASELCADANGAHIYWNGGEAISNYIDKNVDACDYTKQLAIPTDGGHNGSKNFCVHNGSINDYSPTTGYIYFKDTQPRIIGHLWVTNTSYYLGTVNQIATASDWTKIVATGYDGNDTVVGTSEFYLTKDGKSINEWTKWELSALGACVKVAFDIQSSMHNEYGMVAPAYFAYDDVAVVPAK